MPDTHTHKLSPSLLVQFIFCVTKYIENLYIKFSARDVNNWIAS